MLYQTFWHDSICCCLKNYQNPFQKILQQGEGDKLNTRNRCLQEELKMGHCSILPTNCHHMQQQYWLLPKCGFYLHFLFEIPGWWIISKRKKLIKLLL